MVNGQQVCAGRHPARDRPIGETEFIRSDNGSEFIATALGAALQKVGVDVKCIAPGAPWENGYAESFHGQLRAALLDMEVFTSLAEAKRLGKDYRRMYNTERPHGSLKMMTPVDWAAQHGRPELNRRPVESRAHSRVGKAEARHARPVTQRAPSQFART